MISIVCLLHHGSSHWMGMPRYDDKPYSILKNNYSHLTKSGDGPWRDAYPVRTAASLALTEMAVKHQQPICDEYSDFNLETKDNTPEKTENQNRIPMIKYNP